MAAYLKILIDELKFGLLVLIGQRVNAPAQPGQEAENKWDGNLHDVVDGDIEEDEEEDLVADAARHACVPWHVCIVSESKEGHDVDDSEAHLLDDAVLAERFPVHVLLQDRELIHDELKHDVADGGNDRNDRRQQSLKIVQVFAVLVELAVILRL